MNHCQAGGMKISKFIVGKAPDGSVLVPMWSAEQTLGRSMDGIWTHLFIFVEDYLAIALHFRLRLEEFGLFRVEVAPQLNQSSWKLTTKAEADPMIARLGGGSPI